MIASRSKIFFPPLVRSVICILFATACSSCAFQGAAISSKPTTQFHKSELTTIWHLSTQLPIKGVITLLPGLNTKPSTLNSIATWLKTEGYHSVILHYLDFQTASEVGSYPDWEAKLIQLQGKLREDYPGIPKAILGYSLGGLIATHTASRQEVYPDAMILLAPALEIRERSYLIGFLNWLRMFDLSLPSQAPTEYRDRSHTPLEAYHQLLLLQSKVSDHVNTKQLNRIPTVMITHEDDELVSQAKLHYWLNRHGINWREVTLRGKKGKQHLLHHIIVDEYSLGEENWEKVKQSIRGLLENMR